MKVLMRKLAARLQRLSPPAITTIGLCCVLGLGPIDYYTPAPLSFVLFYMLVVVLVGRRAGKWHAVFVAGVAVVTMATVQWGLGRGARQTVWEVLWNNSTRFLVFSIAGWLTAEVTRLTRHLSDLVEERTAQWKAEVEQHKATSTRLREALERFEQVVNNITEVFWLTDVAKNQMAYISPGYERIWGRTCEELYREPRSWVAAVHPADHDEVLRSSLTDQAAGSYDVEYRILRPDGAVRWIRDRAFPVRNEQGEVYRIAGLAQDITERKQTREVLQTQAAILENMAEGVVVTDEQGVIVQMNPAGERIWGYERNEVLGQPVNVLSALPEPEATALTREVLEALQTNGSWCGTFKNRRKDGATIICEAVINRVEIQDRVLMVAVEQDVTERVRGQEQLQVQARVLESMAEAVLMVDETGTIVLTNPALDMLLGYETGELAGQPMHVLAGISPEAHNRNFKATVEQVRTGGSSAGEYLARRKDGGLIEVETRSSGVSVGGRFYLVVVGQDITERKRREGALRQSEETLRVFLNAIPEPAFLLDRNGTILVSNQVLTRRLGLPDGDLIGKDPLDLIPSNLAESRRAMFDRVIRNREPVRFEDARGGRHFLNFQSPVLDPAGNVTRVAAFALDITERKQAESALARQEELYRTLFELSPNGILLEDASGKILDANQALCESSGYTREELLRQNVRCFVPAEDQSAAKAHLATLRAGQTVEHEAWNLRKSGERRLIRLNEKPLTLPDGRRGIMVVARDITESKRVELTKEAFLSLGAKLSAASSPVEAARAIYASADLLWKWDSATLDLCSPESGRLQTVLNCDVVDGRRCEVPPVHPGGTPSPGMLRIMRDGAQLLLEEQSTQATDFVVFGDTSRLSASLMYAPLRQEGRAVGVLSIQSYTPKAYTEEDLRTLQALADHCGGALERIHAEETLREAHDQLERRVRERTAELRAANEALGESEGKYRRLHESMTDAFVSVDMSGRITEFNPAYQALLGYTSEELRNLTYVHLTPEKWHAMEARIVTEQILPQGYSEVYEKEYRCKDGTIFPVEMRTFLIRDAHGQPAAMWAIVRDITERKLAEEALREAHDQLERRVQERTAELQVANAALGESEERYRSLVNNLNVGVYRNTPGPHGRFIHANPALARMHGYDSVEEFQKVRVADLYQQPGERKEFLAEVLRQGSVVNHEVRLKKRDGTPIYVSVNATVHRGPNGEVDWIDGMLEDITDRKTAEEALRASEERYRALAESSPDAIFILDRDIKVQYVNSRAAALWRRAPEELIGVTQPELFPPEVAQYHCKVVAEVFETGQPVRRDEPLAFPTGEQWIEIRLVPLYGEQGTVSSVMGVCRDITERKRAERQLAEALDLNQKMIAASVMGIAAYRASGECVFANEALARTVGGSVSEVQQGNFRRLESWQKSGMLQLAEEALSQRQAQSGEVYTTTSFGKSVWVDCHVAPFVSSGQPHLLLMALDISERKRAEEALRQSETRLRAIVTGAPVLLFAVDQDGIIRFEDGQALQALGATRGANVGRSVMEVYAHVPAILENARRALRGEAFESIVEAGPVTFDCWYSPTRDKEGKPTGYIGVATNITERHRLEHQILEISDREQARIGQDIHDGLCQHLVSLAFDANALQRELSAENRPEAKTARRIADFLDQAITESRQLSRGLFPVRLGTVGLSPALQELANSTSARFKIRCRFAGKEPVAVTHAAVATHLYRIAQEAVANAVKHSRARTVCIRLRARTNQVELTVEDDGAGLSPAKRKEATGLGLHIMDYRARAVGGTLHIGPGRRGGTIVSCCVPVRGVKQ